jgi:hypothetical protein
MADYTNQIRELEDVLNGATESISVDGTSVKISLSEARKRLAELRGQDTESIATGKVRPRVAKLRLDGAW